MKHTEFIFDKAGRKHSCTTIVSEPFKTEITIWGNSKQEAEDKMLKFLGYENNILGE